jgi:hypothetical protein
VITANLDIKILAFIGTSLGIISQSTDPFDPRTIAGAIAGGCGAVLALSKSPAQSAPPLTREQRVAAVREVGRG